MSDPQNQPSPSAPPPVAPSSPVTEPVGPNTVLFEAPTPVAPPEPVAPVAPPAPEPYKVSHLENGQYEVRLETGHVFKGDHDAIVNELAKAQYHATKHIAELNGKRPPEPQQIPQNQLQPGQVDPTALALADLAAQGMGFKDAAELKAAFAPLETMQQRIQQQDINNEAARFLANTQDYPNSDVNNDKIGQIMDQFGLPPTFEAMQLAHHYLKGTGQYERVLTPAKPVAQPLPTLGNGNINDVALQDAWTMPLEQLEAQLRNQRG